MTNRETLVNPGDEIELLINSVNHQGSGVGRYQGLAVFVPFTVPGEKVAVEITGLKKNHALGRVKKILDSTGIRVEPRCPVFETCGGSQFQHIDYAVQLEIKRKLIEESLVRIGRVNNTVVKPVVGMTDPWGYRNKAQFQVNEVGGRIKLGFFEEGSHELVPTTDCLLLDRQVRDIASMIEGMLNKYRVSPYDWESEKGLLRHVIVRKGWHTSKIMVVLVTSDEKFPEQFTLGREIKAKVPRVVSVVRNINAGPVKYVFGRDSILLAGHNSITDRIGDFTFTISPTSFFQVNPQQTEVLYKKAVEYAGLTGNETVLDLYCGIGTITLFLAQKSRWVFGLEVSREAVKDAADNARANNIINVEFITGRAEERLPGLRNQGIRPDVVVVDPPRQGIEKRALQAIADMGPKRIIYISCDPGTMARDVNFLSYRGYKAVEVQPVDMFPQTAHVECCVRIERVKG